MSSNRWGPSGPKCLLSILLGAGIAAAQSHPEEESFLRQVMLRNPSIQAESLSVAGVKETETGLNTLLMPQFNITGKAGAYSNLDAQNGYSGSATGTASKLFGTGGTLYGSAQAGRQYDTSATHGESTYDTIGVTVGYNQHFLRGFGSSNDTLYNIEQAGAELKVQTATSRATILSLLSSARKAWWNQRTLEAALVARVQDSVRTGRLLADSRQKLSSGAGSRQDTVQAFANHLEARSNWFSAWSSAHAGAVELGSYLDSTEMWIGDPLHDTTLSLPTDADVPPVWTSVDSLMQLAEKDAPDLAEALAEEEKAKSAKIYYSRQTLPALDAGVYARKAFLPDGTTTNKNVVFGVSGLFSWNIPDGVNAASARKALLDLRKAGITATKARHDLRRTLQKLVDESQQYAQAITLARELVKAQDISLAAAEQGYHDGSTSWSDLVQTRQSWLSAISTVWNNIYQAQQIESEIQSLTGTGPARLGWNWGE